MMIEVTEDHRITSDERQWIVQSRKILGEKSENAGQWSEWQSITYHPTLAMAGQSLSERFWRLYEPAHGEGPREAIRRLDGIVRAAVELSQAWRARP